MSTELKLRGVVLMVTSLVICMIPPRAKTLDGWLADMRDRDPFVRELSVIALSNPAVHLRGLDRCLAALNSRRTENNRKVRSIAQDAYRKLLRVKFAQFLDAVRAGNVNRSVARSLFELKSPIITRCISDALEDPTVTNKELFARMLAETGVTAMPALARATHSEVPEVRKFAKQGLDALRDKTPPSALSDSELFASLCVQPDDIEAESELLSRMHDGLATRLAKIIEAPACDDPTALARVLADYRRSR